jgi:CheY-like chemotaxis protein
MKDLFKPVRPEENEVFPPRTIVVVGENPTVRSYIRQLLAAAGHNALEGANLEHTQHIVCQLNTNLDLILACSESERDADRIRQWHAEYNQVPMAVIRLSSGSIRHRSRDAVAIQVRVALRGDSSGSSVLVAAEDASERNLLANVLETAGYRVRKAANGREAIALCRDNAPRILLTDVVMPEEDGLQLILQVRAEYPDTAVFAMSGGPRAQSYVSMARRFGAKGIFTKPFSVEDLLLHFKDALNSPGARRMPATESAQGLSREE